MIGEDLIGDATTIWASADGGATFAAQHTAPGVSLLGLQALDAQSVWACGGDRLGEHGVILHTADGGATWVEQLSGADVPCLNGVYLRDDSVGWAVASGRSGLPHRRRRRHVAARAHGVPTTADLRAVAFGDARHGCIVGDGVVLLTADAGTTWIDYDADVVAEKAPTLRVITHALR